MPEPPHPVQHRPRRNPRGREHHVAPRHLLARKLAPRIRMPHRHRTRDLVLRSRRPDAPASARRCTAGPRPQAPPPAPPPDPRYMSTPVLGWAAAITPATSPSSIRVIRAPASRHCAMIRACRSRSRMHTTRSEMSRFLASARLGQVLQHRRIQIDHALRQPRPDRDLVHVDVRRVQEIALLGQRQHRQRRWRRPWRWWWCPPAGPPRYPSPARHTRPSRRYTASAPRPSRPRRSPRCPRWRPRRTRAASPPPPPRRPRSSLPRPIQRDAASAAASVTRTSSSARLRSLLSSRRWSMAAHPLRLVPA